MNIRQGALARFCLTVVLFVLVASGRPSFGAEAQESGVLPDGYGLAVGGQYRAMFSASDFGWHPATITPAQQTVSFANERLRTWLNFHDATAKDHGVYIQVELGHSGWGDDREGPKVLAAELRRGYLWYKPTDESLLRVGVIDWHDRFGERPSFTDPLWAVDAYDSFRAVLANSIWDFNVGGVSYEGTSGGKHHYRFAAVALGQGNTTFTGDGGTVLAAADIDCEVGTSLLGASLYVLHDGGDYSYPGAVYDSSLDVWAGVRGHFKFGQAKPSFFVIFNTGETTAPDWEHTGFAVKAAVDVDAAIGKLSFQALYATGNDGSSATDSDEFRTIAQSVGDNFGAQGYWSLLGLSSPRGPADVNDLGAGLQNRGLGLITLQGALERKLNETLTCYAALGFLQAAEDNPTSGAANMGIEILGELHWTLKRSLGLDVGAAYLLTGDFYKTAPAAPGPDDLFQLYARLQLEF